jgi:hypothetical protein
VDEGAARMGIPVDQTVAYSKDAAALRSICPASIEVTAGLPFVRHREAL